MFFFVLRNRTNHFCSVLCYINFFFSFSNVPSWICPWFSSVMCCLLLRDPNSFVHPTTGRTSVCNHTDEHLSTHLSEISKQKIFTPKLFFIDRILRGLATSRKKFGRLRYAIVASITLPAQNGCEVKT